MSQPIKLNITSQSKIVSLDNQYWSRWLMSRSDSPVDLTELFHLDELFILAAACGDSFFSSLKSYHTKQGCKPLPTESHRTLLSLCHVYPIGLCNLPSLPLLLLNQARSTSIAYLPLPLPKHWNFLMGKGTTGDAYYVGPCDRQSPTKG